MDLGVLEAAAAVKLGKVLLHILDRLAEGTLHRSLLGDAFVELGGELFGGDVHDLLGRVDADGVGDALDLESLGDN